MQLVEKQLLDRLHIVAKKKVKNFPFLMGQGIWHGSKNLGRNDSIAEVMKQGTLTFGFIGLAECLTSLVGKHHGESAASQKLGLKIIKFMRDYADKAAIKHNLNFSLIATPAEGLSGRFVKIDAKKYGKIKGVTDKDYYTNSFHVPVRHQITAFEKINLEAPYHALTNAGHISYVELDGAAVKNAEAFEAIIRHMAKAGIGYGSINHPVDRCNVCGYNGIIDDECPNCHIREDSTIKEYEAIKKRLAIRCCD
jgi:ribonucleoside-triphosphate reductase